LQTECAKLNIFPHVRVNGVLEHRHRVRLDWHNHLHFRQRRMPIQLARAFRDVRSLIASRSMFGESFMAEITRRRSDATG
jgi:hypothetical protein